MRSWNWTAEKLTATAASVGQAAASRQRLLEDPAADVEDEAGLLGDRDELGGGDVAARRVMPADQRLEGRDLALRHGDDGLEGEGELALLDRGADVELERAALLRHDVEVLLEVLDAVPAVRLGLVERHVGALQQHVDGLAVKRGQGDAEARADVDAVAVDLVGLADARP